MGSNCCVMYPEVVRFNISLVVNLKWNVENFEVNQGEVERKVDLIKHIFHLYEF